MVVDIGASSVRVMYGLVVIDIGKTVGLIKQWGLFDVDSIDHDLADLLSNANS